ncbi:MAG: hypothetical protein QHH04_01475 [Methanolinea sp.]|jgi:hypothetical protein|nr:hypothetical protein [Methanolinea sp.]
MKAFSRDPWIDSFLRRPDVRTKLSFFLFSIQVAIYVTIVAGLLIFMYLVLIRTF